MPSRPRRPAYARGDRSATLRSPIPRPRPSRVRNPQGRSVEEGRSGPAKKIYVLDERGEMAGEYTLDSDCPIDYNDFLKVLPNEGIGDRDSLFVGEYVFTAFQSGKFVFVLLSRGQLAPEDVNWTALLLTAADSHLAAATSLAAPARAAESKPEVDKGLAERDARLQAKEKSLAELDAKLKADAANLSGRQEELDRQKARLAALADYSTQLQDAVSKGASRSAKTLE